jgi:type I restriction enzyme S subunit
LYFQTREYRNAISDAAAGTNINNLKREYFEAIRVPVPPLAEQRRIVAKVEELLGRVNAARERLAKVPALLKRFRQSVLAAACSGQLTGEWREQNAGTDDASGLVAKLEQVHEAAGGHKRGNAALPTEEAHDLDPDGLPPSWRLTDLRTAVCPDRPITYGILKPGPDTPGGIPYVRVADFPNDRLKLGTIRRTTTEIEKTYARARLRQGDILLSIRGTVGRVCFVPAELEDANITQDTARLSIQPLLDTCFVVWFLRTPATQKRMQKALKGVAVRGINIGDVRALQLPVPPLAEQREIVRRVESLFALADKIEARVSAATGRVEKITQAILAKAFRGELVPTEAELARQEGRDYEPALVLLERIRAERAQGGLGGCQTPDALRHRGRSGGP